MRAGLVWLERVRTASPCPSHSWAAPAWRCARSLAGAGPPAPPKIHKYFAEGETIPLQKVRDQGVKTGE